MKIFTVKCEGCKKDFILGQAVVGLDTGEKKIFPLHSFCAKKISGEEDGVVMHSSKHQRKMVREAHELGKEGFEAKFLKK